MISSALFEKNRKRLVNGQGGVYVFAAYAAMQRGNDASFPFEQEANFWWLTGIEEPDWQLIIEGSKSWLVSPTLSDTHVIFDGGLTDHEAKDISGIDAVISEDDARKLLRDLAKKHSVVHALADHAHQEYFDFTVNPAQKKLWNNLDRIFTSVKDVRLDVAKLRAIKQPEEIQAIKKAIKITSDAFEYVKQKLPQLKNEYEIEAEFTYYFKMNGAKGHAYDPIIAGGKNACTLHYNRNTDKLKKGLILLDIGARADGYAADITRTWAVGDISKRQQQVHAAVEKAHLEIIKLLKPGLAIGHYHDEVDRIMKSALDSLGLLKSDEDYRRYFPHAISHGLGVDVHDALGQPTEFSEGMVLTVEPGIYIPEESIGVRIEDDILITDSGHTNLSKKLSVSM